MKRFPVVLALLTLIGVSHTATRGADLLPGAAIGDDTVMVIWVDIAKLKHETVLATLKATMGKEAKLLDDAMKKFAMMKQSFLNAGGHGFAMVVRAPESGRMPDPFFLVKVKPGNQIEGMEAFLKLLVRNEPMLKVDKTSLIVADRDRDFPQLGEKPGKNHKQFMQQLAKLTEGTGSPAGVVFKPNARLRAEMDRAKGDLANMEQFMPGITDLFLLMDHAVRSDMLTLSATVGETPSAKLSVTTKDGDAAKALVAQHAKGLVSLNAMIQRAQQQNNGRRVNEEAMMFSIMKELLQSKPEIDGKTVLLKANKKAFESVGKIALRIIKVEQERAKRYALQNQMRQILIAIQAYAADKGGAAPDKLEDLHKYIGGKEALAKLMKHPITGEANGIVYYKPPQNLNQIERPNITALLFELRKGKIVEGGVTGYADGHVQGGNNNFNGAVEDSIKSIDAPPVAVE